MKEFRLGQAEHAPHSIQLADHILNKILQHNEAQLISSYKTDSDYAANLNKMQKFTGSEILLGTIKQPKDLPEIIFVGKDYDMKNTRAVFTQNNKVLTIQSPEGERLILLAQNGIAHDDIKGIKNTSTKDISVDKRQISNGEQIPEVLPIPPDLIIIFVGARMQQKDVSYGSINAYSVF